MNVPDLPLPEKVDDKLLNQYVHSFQIEADRIVKELRLMNKILTRVESLYDGQLPYEADDLLVRISSSQDTLEG